MNQHRHFIIHKPFGYLSQFVNHQNRRRNKKLLGDLGDFPEGIMAIGRLDEHSEGLLLLTTDGKESMRIRSKLVEKEYYVMVDGLVTPSALQSLQHGVEIRHKSQTYQTLPAKVRLLEPAPVFEPRPARIRDDRHGPTSWVSITITEGKFRQVRKMTSEVGFPTLRLIRVRVGNVLLGDLPPGQSLEVDEFDTGLDG